MTRRTARPRLEPTHRTHSTQAFCGVAGSFYCHGFCKPTHMQHIAIAHMNLHTEANNSKELHLQHEQKHTPKKLA